jgi:crotonobetainyl-CoA:carnitine CoA-transferase CaiB-like acyl-CoA transferase
VVGSHLIPGQPFRYSGVDRWIRTPAPTVGQHNEAVFAELLGLTGDEIEALRRDAVIGDAPVG